MFNEQKSLKYSYRIFGDAMTYRETGFIYILSNPSMKGVLKVGMTTKSVRERVSELNTTGVPRSFVIEKTFEVDQSFLNEVERTAHKILKGQRKHHGKEFFKCDLDTCKAAVEDAIYQVTGSSPSDQARERAAQKEFRDQQINLARAAEEKRRADLQAENMRINQLRESHINYLKIKEGTSGDEMNWLLPLVLLAFGGIGVLLMLVAYGFLFYSKAKRDERYEAEAARVYPYKDT